MAGKCELRMAGKCESCVTVKLELRTVGKRRLCVVGKRSSIFNYFYQGRDSGQMDKYNSLHNESFFLAEGEG